MSLEGLDKKRRLRILLTGFLAAFLVFGPAVHAGVHPYEINRNATCPTTGFPLTLDPAGSGFSLPECFGTVDRLALPAEFFPFLLYWFSPQTIRGPPDELAV